MTDVITEAHSKRYKLPEGDGSKKGIVLSETWSKELLKHPYLSRKHITLTMVAGKAGTGIFLMKERAKLYKTKSVRVKHEISKRLSQAPHKPEESKHQGSANDKRVNLGGGKWTVH